MTRVDRLELQVRVLRARVDAWEATQAARPAPRKRAVAPRPDDSVIAAREELWAKYLRLEMTHGHGRVKLTKLAFAVRHRLNPDEFCRWFSPTDRRGVPAGSGPDRRFRQALVDAIAELQTRGGPTHSHGSLATSQDSGSRLQ